MQVEAEEEFLTNGLQVKLEKVPPPHICRILFPLHICRTLYHLHICTISLNAKLGSLVLSQLLSLALQMRQEKVDLEVELGQEQEKIFNQLHKQLSSVKAEKE